MRNDELVILGDGANIDSCVHLAYRGGRSIELAPMRIGMNARIRTGTAIYTNTAIGDYLETGHNTVIREENVIGDHFSIWNNSVVDYGCKIGSNVRLHSNVYIAQLTTIEDDVFVAPGVSTANDPHPLCKKCMKGPTLKKSCRIGANATILAHVTIGEGALIGAGSVVTRDIPAYSVAYGHPARPRKHVDELICQFDLVTPYIGGMDVLTREREAQKRK